MAEQRKIEGKEQLMTPANIVTLIRIVCIPVFVLVILGPWTDWVPSWSGAESWKPWIAAAVFILLSITDTLDGYLARSRGEVTDLGKFMDPLADKILVSAALLALIELGVLPSWVAMIILAREFIVSGIRMVAASKSVVIAASWYGKAKTVFQMLAIILFIVKDSPLLYNSLPITPAHLYIFSWIIMAIAVILTIISMLDYFVKAKEILGFTKSNNDEMTENEPSLDEMAILLKDSAEAKNLKIGFAESCTGGMISSTITDIPGISNVFYGSVVSYSNEAKSSLLHVSDSSLSNFGAVSEQVACEMASGARNALDVDAAVSVTGIAGPDGGSEEKPVGTVWIGVSCGSVNRAKRYLFNGDRSAIRESVVRQAIKDLIDVI